MSLQLERWRSTGCQRCSVSSRALSRLQRYWQAGVQWADRPRADSMVHGCLGQDSWQASELLLTQWRRLRAEACTAEGRTQGAGLGAVQPQVARAAQLASCPLVVHCRLGIHQTTLGTCAHATSQQRGRPAADLCTVLDAYFPSSARDASQCSQAGQAVHQQRPPCRAADRSGCCSLPCCSWSSLACTP